MEKRLNVRPILLQKTGGLLLKSLYDQKFTSNGPVSVQPMGKIAGYPVRPGMFDKPGAFY